MGMVRDISRLQTEVEHMNRSITESVALQKEIKQSLDDEMSIISSKISNPELSKAWIIGAFSLCCGIMTMFTGIIVVVVNNADKIGKLLGWS
jgi:hypothetical protein